MEAGTTMIGLVVLALFIVPIVFLQRNRKKKEKALWSGLDRSAHTHHSDVALRDIGDGFAIGLSSARNHIFFYDNRNGEAAAQCIAVNSLQKCKANTVKHRIRTQKGPDEITDRLELVLHTKGDDRSPFRLVFYDSQRQFQMNGEPQLLEKWEKIIRDAMTYYI